MSENKTETYRMSKDDKTHEITVKMISNGYIVCKYTSWYEGEGDKKEYKSENVETYYKENPFEESEKKKDKEDIADVVKDLKAFMEKNNPVKY